jgi:HEAT repeat protein
LLTVEHALAFYPEGHQARQVPLERVLALLRAEAAISGEGALGLAGEVIQWRGGLYGQLPTAARKLSALLGARGIARLSWSPELTTAEVQEFFSVLARSRSAGTGWDHAARFEHLQVEGLDYQALMAPEAADAEEGMSAEHRNLWQVLLLRTLADPAAELTAEELQLIREHWGDPEALASLLEETIGPGAQAGDPGAVEAVRRFAALVERAAAAGETPPEGESAQKLAAVAHHLPPELRLSLLEAALDQPAGELFPAAFGTLAPDEGLALIARTFTMDPGQIGRLTRVFQHLVPRQLERMELAPQLREEILKAGNPDDPIADNTWEEVQELLTGEAGDFMSPGYQDQLRQLSAREEARSGGEQSLAVLPDLVEDLASERTAAESLLIQIEQLRLATNAERYREALDGLGGLCGAALAAGDRERGLRILRQLLEISASQETLAGPRADIERTLAALGTRPVLQALLPFLGTLGAEEQAAVRNFLSLARPVAIPVLLDALVAEEDPGRRREVALQLKEFGGAALPEMVQRLSAAPPAVARTLLPLVAELRDPVAVPALIGLLGRDDTKLRRDALRVLVGIDSPEVRRALPQLLEDPDQEIVQVAAAHLGAVGSPETVRALLRVFEGKRFGGSRTEELLHAIFVLGRMRAPEAVAPLSELLLRRTWINRRLQEHLGEAAAQALARIGGETAKQALEQASARGSAGLAAVCRRLLARWGGA